MNPDLPTETAFTPKVPTPDLKPPTVEIVPSNKPATIKHSDVQPIKRKIGDYSVIRELGRGGMGVVYLARQESLSRHVALKVIPAGPDASPADLKRFRTEAETAASLTHSNIVAIYEAGEADGVAYVAMEYVHGGTLHDHIYKNPLPPSDAAAIVEALARAVECAHEKGIIHRDIKPSNILLAPKGEPCRDGIDLPWIPKVADFGLAKRLDNPAITGTNVVMGTPNYMSPEQAQGHHQKVGKSTDIYALGAVLYEALTGYPPFNGETSYEIMQHVVRTPPTRPTHLRVGIPNSIESVCLKALEKDPKKRFSSAKELADTLALTFKEQQPPTVRSSSIDLPKLPEKPKVAPFRGLWLLVLASAVLVLSLGVWRTSRGLSNADKENKDLQSKLEENVQSNKRARQLNGTLTLQKALFLFEQGDPDGVFELGVAPHRSDSSELNAVIEKNRLAWSVYRLKPVAGTPKESPDPDGFDPLPKRDAKPASTVIHPKTKVTATLDKKSVVIIPSGKEMDNPTRHACPEELHEIHWSPDANHQRLFGISKTGIVYAFDPSLPSWMLIPETDPVRVIGFSPDGNLFALGTENGRITVWDCVTLQRLSFYKFEAPEKLIGSIEWIRWNKNQTRIGYQTATQSGLLICSKPFERGSIRVDTPIVGLDWGASGKLYVGQNQSALTFATGETTPSKMTKERGTITDCVSLSAIQKDPESLLLVTRENKIYHVDPTLDTEGNLRVYPEKSFPNSKSLEKITLHKKEHLTLVQGVSNDFEIKQAFYILGLEQPEQKVRYLKNLSAVDPVCITLDPIQNWAYLVTPSDKIEVWNLDLDEKIREIKTQINISALAVDPTGKRLAIGSKDGALNVLDIEDGNVSKWFVYHKGRVNVLLWNGGDLISGSNDKTTRVWDGETGIQIGPSRPHPHAVTRMSLRGKNLAVGSAEGVVRVWTLP